ncbi:hypothetical protein EDD15DRAFT_2196081 [Pisolithus albus]|nr:hypothetical protein EDD15DRAFT_2196081 [Pisolithus albus]
MQTTNHQGSSFRSRAPHKRDVFTDVQGGNSGTSIAKDIYTDDYGAQQREVATCRDRRWDRRWLFNPVAKDGRVNSTLGSIRGFLGDEMPNVNVENRILTVTISERSRLLEPSRFREGGNRRIACENNIVLSFRQGGLGALIDFDMAIVGRPNMHQDSIPPSQMSEDEMMLSIFGPPTKSQRTATYGDLKGTTPYMSIGVLEGDSHTHFDDIESFLYVLVLFFLSYKGPLKVEKLREAQVQGFIQPVGMGRLPHVTTMVEPWRRGTFEEISVYKLGLLSADHCHIFVEDCIPQICSRWEGASQSIPECLARLIFRRQVTHRQFIEVLETWLKQCTADVSAGTLFTLPENFCKVDRLFYGAMKRKGK